ncbi:hypothetical protein Glove_85g12 [Diversispora epigaea]|nr:hypothetical protein Glove_85g12 [Diversispora epigaea]
MVNAIPYQLHKRAIDFGPCPDPPIPLLTVSLSSDTIEPGKTVTITISGKLAEEVPAVPESTLVQVAFTYADGTIIPNSFFSKDLCTRIKCPISAGTTFSIVENVPVPAELPLFKIMVGINDTEEFKFLGCASTGNLS